MSSDAAHCFNYVACDIPPGMTIQAWKREKARAAAARKPARRPLLTLLRRSR